MCALFSSRLCIGEAWAFRRAGAAVRGKSDFVLSPLSLRDLPFASLQGQRRTASVRVRSHEASRQRTRAEFPRALVAQAELWCLEKVAFEEVLTDHLREAPAHPSDASRSCCAKQQEIMRRIEIQDLSRAPSDQHVHFVFCAGLANRPERLVPCSCYRYWRLRPCEAASPAETNPFCAQPCSMCSSRLVEHRRTKLRSSRSAILSAIASCVEA